MPQRICSVVGTVLLALAVASPALAQKKRSKKAATEEKAAEEKKAAAEAEKKKEEETPLPDDSAWEKPPVEDEKPAPAPIKGVKAELDTSIAKPWSAALVLGYGFMTDRRSQILVPQDPYTLAMGIRGGYTFDFKLYAGLFFTYYLGSSGSGGISGSVANEKSAANYIQFGAEGGYDWAMGPVLVRPSLQLGPAIAIVDPDGGKTTSTTGMMFGPGIAVLAPIDDWFIGGEGRFILIAGDGPAAFLVAANGGLRF